MKKSLWLCAAVLLAADQRVTESEEISVLRLRTKVQDAESLAKQAELIWTQQQRLLCGDNQKPGECLGGVRAQHDAALKKLKDAYASKNLELQYDLSLRPIQEAKPAAKPVEAKK